MLISMKVKIRVQWEYGREGVKKGIKGDKWENYKYRIFSKKRPGRC